MNSSTNVGALAAALAEFQGGLGAVGKDKRGQIGVQKYRYADLPGVWDTIREPLARHGLSVVQPATTDGDTVSVRTIILHSSGEWLDCGACSVDVAEAPKGITLVQARGSAITYLRRYGLSSALGIVADDDDGASAGHRGGDEPRRTERQPERPPQDAPPVDDLPLSVRVERAVEFIGRHGVALGDVEAELGRIRADWTADDIGRIRGIVKHLTTPAWGAS